MGNLDFTSMNTELSKYQSPDLNIAMDRLQEKALLAYEEVMHNVAVQYLGREPTEADAGTLHRISLPDVLDREAIITSKGVTLGEITCGMVYDEHKHAHYWRVTFVPARPAEQCASALGTAAESPEPTDGGEDLWRMARRLQRRNAQRASPHIDGRGRGKVVSGGGHST